MCIQILRRADKVTDVTKVEEKGTAKMAIKRIKIARVLEINKYIFYTKIVPGKQHK